MNTSRNKDRWDSLSMKEKSDMMKVAVQQGIYNLSDIRKTYNEYAEGGPENNGNPRPITTGGAGYVPSSSSNVQIFNKEKIYNRVLPTEMTGANTGPLDSVKQYLFNNDRAVDEWFEDYVPYINNSYGDAIKASRIINDLYRKAGTEKEQESLENSPTMKALMYQKLAPEMFVQEDGKDTYLGMPQRFGTMRDAEYHPANGKLVNGKYVSYMRDPIFVDTEIIPTYQNYMMGITRKDNPESNVQRVTKNGNALVYMPFLNNATMSKGYDPNRGEYISIYDDWDYNTAVLGKAGDNISKFIGGQPFSIYDRYYLDDIFDVPKDKRGSYYLPEVTVIPDKKSTGGPLITLANEFSKGGKIHIKPSHRGKFTRLKERTGHSASWFKENGTPAQKKMATFALNARKWKHGDGGPLVDLVNYYVEGGPENQPYTPFLNETPMQAAMKQIQSPEARAAYWNATHPQTTNETPIVAQPDGTFRRETRNIPLNTAAEAAKTALEFTPVIGDVMFAGDIADEARQGNYGTAAALAGLAVLPNIVEKPLKKGLKKIGLFDNATTAAKATPAEWTAAQDAAIAAGDMAEAQRLRDLHFKINTPENVVTKEGMPTHNYHGTKTNFNEFDLKYFGQHDPGDRGYGFYFSQNRDVASDYGNVVNDYYLNATTPYTGKDWYSKYINRGSKKDIVKQINDKIDKEDARKIELLKEKYPDLDAKSVRNAVSKSSSAERENIIGSLGNIENTDAYLSPYENVVYKPNQIKSADAVTYDNNGVRVPLGERDNFNVNDIRYIWPTALLGGTAAASYTNQQGLGGPLVQLANKHAEGGDISDEYYAGTLPEVEVVTPRLNRHIAEPSSTYTAPYVSEIPDIRFVGSRYDRDTLTDKGGKPSDDMSYKERWERQKRERTTQDWKDLYNGLQRTVGTSVAGANLLTGGPWALNRLLNGNKASATGQLFSKYLLATNALDNYNDAIDLVANPSLSGAADLATGLALSRFRDFGSRARQIGELVGQGANVYNIVDNYKALGGPIVQKANKYEEGGPTDESNNIVDWIIGEEGFNSKPENIGDGKITLGSGLTNSKWHKIYNKKGTWTAEDNRAAVAEEVENRRRWAEQNVPNWTELPKDSQNALLSYKYNYNFTPKNSPKLFKALEDRNYEEAARQMDATSSNPKFKKGLQARRQREQELFMRGINSMNAPEPEVVEEIPQEESIYTPPQRVLDTMAAHNGKYMIMGNPPLAGVRNTVLDALRRLKALNLFVEGGPLVDLANRDTINIIHK